MTRQTKSASAATGALHINRKQIRDTTMLTATREKVNTRPPKREPAEPIRRTLSVSYAEPWVREKLRKHAGQYDFLIDPATVTPASMTFDVMRTADGTKPYQVPAVIREGKFHPVSCSCPAKVHYCKHMLLFMDTFKTMPRTAATALTDRSKHAQAPTPTDSDAPSCMQKQWLPGDEEDWK